MRHIRRECGCYAEPDIPADAWKRFLTGNPFHEESGSRYQATGSIWYFPGGQQPITTHAKFISHARSTIASANWVSSQGERSEPDIAIVAGRPSNYREAPPTTAASIVEVVLTSLEYDREVKGALYANAGIPEYWIVNLDKRCIGVYRDPAPMEEGYAYRSRRIYLPGEQTACLQKPEKAVKVGHLLLS